MRNSKNSFLFSRKNNRELSNEDLAFVTGGDSLAKDSELDHFTAGSGDPEL